MNERDKIRQAIKAHKEEWLKSHPRKPRAKSIEAISNLGKELREKKCRQQKEYAIRNAEKLREYRRINAKARCEKSKAWNHANKEHRAAYMRKYQKDHPEKWYEACMNRRAKMYATSTIGDRKAIVAWMKEFRAKDDVECFWCKDHFKGNECHADHVMPLKLGGAHSLENLQIACASCNRRKNKTHPDHFGK